ncbi:unnamed protein product [Rhizopus stolonifer]
MSIDALIVSDSLPLSPPTSFKSSSRSPSPVCSRQPMSAKERKYRNKLASAKYRAKKQESMKSMSSRVSQLMTFNYQLSRELTKTKQENEVLRTMYEKVISQQSSSLYQLPPFSFD